MPDQCRAGGTLGNITARSAHATEPGRRHTVTFQLVQLDVGREAMNASDRLIFQVVVANDRLPGPARKAGRGRGNPVPEPREPSYRLFLG